MKKILKLYKQSRNTDPVKHCAVYKEFGCAHVDGLLCDMTTCSTLSNYTIENYNHKKYRYLGYTYPDVPAGWRGLVINLIKDIDKIAKPKRIPRWVLNFVHYRATGGSVVRVQNPYWYKVLEKFNIPCSITQIKDKYGGLRFYCSGTDEIFKLVDAAEELSYNVCERCGSMEGVTTNPDGWMYTLCNTCREKDANRFNAVPHTTQWEYINGTRKVIHKPNKVVTPYHDNTMREEVLDKVRGLLYKGEQIYLELYGFEKTGSVIQKGFPYGCQANQYRATMYRNTMNNEDGKVVDYNREAVYARAEELGFEKPHLFEKFYYSGTKRSMELLEEKVIAYAQGQSDIGQGAEDTLKEGVVVWFINSSGRWTNLKYKSDKFRLGESNDRDKGIIDQEDLN